LVGSEALKTCNISEMVQDPYDQGY